MLENLKIPEQPPLNADQDEMDAWLVEVELVHDKIKKIASGELSIEDFDKKEKARQLKKEKEE